MQPHPDLTFDDETHTYRDRDGDVVPSVTQVLQDVGIGGDWEKLEQFGIDLEYSRQMGKAVHRATELYDLDDLDESSLDEGVLRYLLGWVAFREQSGFEPEFAEKVCYSQQYRYAGTVDRIGVLNGLRTVVDIKTGVYLAAVDLQMAGYAYAEFGTIENVRRVAVYLSPESSRGYMLKTCTNPNDLTVFFGALQVYHWQRSKGGK